MEEIGIKTIDYDFEKLFASPLAIKEKFFEIWSKINSNIDTFEITAVDALESLKKFVLYDALDGSRTTLTTDINIEPKYDVSLFSIELIHTLQVLGAKSCVVMVHTDYNRNRGEKEFNRILNLVENGMELVKRYCIQNNIRWRYICNNKNYELIGVLRDVEKQTQNGKFDAYFLFDYNEKWAASENGSNILDKIPDIDVHIRHTKLNFSGGWIPNKMRKSAFLYSQNGSVFSNWKNDEMVALVAAALLAKKLNEGECLTKTYHNSQEIEQRYLKRESDLFQGNLRLNGEVKKLFLLGSSTGTYNIYY